LEEKRKRRCVCGYRRKGIKVYILVEEGKSEPIITGTGEEKEVGNPSKKENGGACSHESTTSSMPFG